MIIRNRHIGRFMIGLDMFQGNDVKLVVRRILSEVVVVRAELSVVADAIEYTGISEKYFDEVKEGNEAPMYTFSIGPDDVIECHS